jgi:hypothetical protein
VTLFTSDPEPGAPPGAGQLAATLASLFQASRTDGKPRSQTLSSGLTLTIALSRKGGVSDMHEARVVAREAGWITYDAAWEQPGQVRYLTLRPSVPEPEPEETPEAPKDEVIRALLLDRAAPWRQGSFTPFMHDLRDDAIRKMKRTELVDEYGYLLRRWERPTRQAQLRYALAHAQPSPPSHSPEGRATLGGIPALTE